MTSLVEILRRRAHETPERTAYVFLVDGEREEVKLTYGELDRKARSIAVRLEALRGERALLLYPPGLEYITAFWGCLYAGVIAVPAYPPRMNRNVERLQAIVADSDATSILTTAATLARMEPVLTETAGLERVNALTTDDVPDELAAAWQARDIDRDSLAFLQYTSGSTATPKGVMVTHRNLLHNEALIQRAFRQTEESIIVGWLPLYHDMGLIGNVLQTVYAGAQCVLMSPVAFLQRPLRWLEAISRYRGTTSGAPNFAYDLCARKITAEQRETLDLSSWTTAFNGSEPVRAETLERFAGTFRECGFRESAFYPCYGLAEATLFVSGSFRTDFPVVKSFAARALEQNQIVEIDVAGEDTQRLVACGKPSDEIVIVNPETSVASGPGEVGEIWIAGESVASGYWKRPEETKLTFGARLVGNEDPFAPLRGSFLRTGDLGFVYDGELFVTGRLKDLIIIRGRNLYPQDIEKTVQESHVSLRAGGGAAFSTDINGEERLVVVQEAGRHASVDDEAAIDAIRQAVAEEHEAQPYAIVLVKAGSVPKTSSGKVQRRACRQMFLSNAFEVLAEWREPVAVETAAAPVWLGAPIGLESSAETASDVQWSVAEIENWLRAQLAVRMGVETSAIDPAKSITYYGIDSLAAIELMHSIETALGIIVPITTFYRSPSINDVAVEAARQRRSQYHHAVAGGSVDSHKEPRTFASPSSTHPLPLGGTDHVSTHPLPRGGTDRVSTDPLPVDSDPVAAGVLAPEPTQHPLSPGQEAMWFLYRLDPANAAYNVPVTVRLRNQIDVTALRSAWQILIERHATLRTTFQIHDGAVVQRTHEHMPGSFVEEDATTWTDASVNLRLADEAWRPFKLEQAPLFRICLLKRATDDFFMQVVAHHIISDLWSLTILLTELDVLYAALKNGATNETASALLPPLDSQYSDYVREQRQMLAAADGERLWTFWQNNLAGELSPLNLLTDRPRTAKLSNRGKIHAFSVNAELTHQLNELSRRSGTTLYTTLLAAYAVLLSRYNGQREVVIGSPTAGRSRAAYTNVVGYFVNLLPFRLDLEGNPSFVELLERVRTTVLDAFTHQDYPFPLIVQRLQPDRDPSLTPLFQTMFVMQQAPTVTGRRLAPFALGSGGAEIQLSELTLESFALEERVTQFELTLSIAANGTELSGLLEYNSELFDASTIDALAQHFNKLLASITAHPEQRIASLPLLTGAETQTLLGDWNDTDRDYGVSGSMLSLFTAQAKKTPDAIALSWHTEHISYRELDERSNRLAHYLRERGAGAEQVVGVLSQRTPDLIVALLAILKTGAAYLPLDPAYPAPRLQLMLEDSQARILITTSALASLVQDVAGPAGSVLSSSFSLLAKDSSLKAELKTFSFGLNRYLFLDQEGAEIARCPATALDDVNVHDENLAYLIYTSGSTGRPKPVAITHRSALTFLHWAREVFSADELAGVLASTSVCFDLSVFELFAPLSWGGEVILVDNALHLATAPGRERVRLINTVPSAMAELLRMRAVPKQVLAVNLAGEALSRSLVRDIYEQTAVGRVLNLYGPSEDTTYSTWTEVRRGSTPTIGRPIANTQVYILDRELQPAPIGVAGELCLGGDGLARGYLGRPQVTAEKFVPDPFSQSGGQRIYRTGDLARWLASGEIEFLGRRDNQVKLRGFRIELGEIETVLRSHEAVRESVLVVSDDRLVAYVVAEAAGVTINELRAFLKERLPEYMVPSVFMMLPEMPLTANGKVDRLRLPQPDASRAEFAAGYVEPVTDVEKSVAGVWAEVLGLERVGVNDNFFELGGHSLLATRIAARIYELFQIELPLRTLFEAPTVATLATVIENASASASAAGSNNLLTTETQRHREEPTAEDVFAAPASFAQRRLWFLHELDPSSTAYNMTAAVRIEGQLNFTALEQSFAEIVRRHESLRTSFTMIDGELMQVISPRQQLRIDRLDLRTIPDDEQDDEVRRQIRLASKRPFDFEKSESLRISLLDLRDGESVMVLVMNHICSDGWSLGVLVKEMVTLYEAFTAGRPSPLPELEIQYLDFAQWQRELLAGKVREEQLAYWKHILSGSLPVIDLSVHAPRKTTRSSEGATELLRLPAQLSKQLNELGRERGATAFMIFLAAFQVLLHRYTGLEDIIVGSPVAGRTRPETQNLIGFFVNTLVMRSDLSGSPRFVDLLARVRESTLEAQTNSDIPFEVLVEELHPERNLGHTQIFQVMFVMQNTPLPDLNLKDVRVSLMDVEETTAKFDLILGFREDELGFTGGLHYSMDRFTRNRIQQLARHFQQLLESVVANPEARVSELPLLNDGERQQLLVEWNDTAAAYPDRYCLHTFFEEQAAKTPDQIALVYEEQQITYAELNKRANQLAHHLRRLGVTTETLVAICLERSIEMIVGVLGILKAGGVYVPLDPSDPPQRLSFTLSDSQAPLLLTQSSFAPGFAEGFADQRARVLSLDADWDVISRESEENPPVDVGPENLAYVIYTSGSTGQPKGVQVTHAAVNSHMMWKRNEVPLTATDRVLQKTSFTFDASISEFFLPFMCGAQLVLARPGGHKDSTYLVETMARQEITLIHLVPAMLRAVLAEKDISECRSLRVVFCGGESLTADVQQRFFNIFDKTEIYHMYGPTEAAIDVAYWHCERDSKEEFVPLGRPQHNVQLHVLDAQLQPVPVGVAGELYAGGANLARGYLNRPDLTAERFIPNPFANVAGQRLYRTGDLVRYLDDGRLEFLGRADSQVKLRGFRIELGEIEAVLRQHESVSACVVVMREDESGEQRVVAYVVPGEERTVAAAELRRYLSERLPVYMIPTTFVALEALPLLSSGKVDRKALPAPDEVDGTPEREYIAPRTPIEEMLAGVWAEVLKLERVSADDNFFDVGGHSLLATRVVSQINEAYPQSVSLRDIFEKPTLADIALLIEQKQAVKPDTATFIKAQPRARKDRARLLENLAQLSDQEARELLTQKKQAIN